MLPLVMATACGSRQDSALSASDRSSDCSLAARRCSRCHGLERIEHSGIREPSMLRAYVHRMRLMPGSGIPPDEEAMIAHCLVRWAGGATSLAELAKGDAR